jgi:hypothetical protein
VREMNTKNLVLLLLLLPLTAFAKDVVTEGSGGGINWTQGYIWADGYGVAPDDAPERKKRLLARRAAQVDAYRNLGEFVEGVRVSSESVVQDLVLASDTIRTKITTVVKGAIMTKDHYQNEVAQVRLQIPFDGPFSSAVNPGAIGKSQTTSFMDYLTPVEGFETVGNALINYVVSPAYAAAEGGALVRSSADLDLATRLLQFAVDQEPSSLIEQLQADTKAYKESNKYTGLLIDASDVSGFQLATIPRLRNTNGDVVYPSDELLGDQLSAKRPVSYDFDVGDAIKNLRVATVPYVIKANSVYKSRNSDLVLSDADAEFIKGNVQLRNAITRAGVMIVISE